LIDRFAQPLKTVLIAVTSLLRLFGVPVRRQFVVASWIHRCWVLAWRRPTRRWRVLPDVLLIGVSKAGTSTLSAWLARHPQFHPPLYKEPHYLDLHAHEDVSWYRAQFPLQARRWLSTQVLGARFVTGDFTPSYYLLPHAPERTRRELGSPKIILSLRNPIDRAYSNYKDSRSIGYEVLDRFEDALAAEPVRLRGELEKMERDPRYCSKALLSFGYKTRGMYINYVRRWRQYYPESDLLILNFDDWRCRPAEVYARICEFLQISRVALGDYAAYNVNEHSFPDIDPRVRRSLGEFFRPYNQALYADLRTDFNWQ
jgi:Sulfotransferase domain